MKRVDVNGVLLHGLWLAAKDMPWWGWVIVTAGVLAKAWPAPSRTRRRAAG